MRKFVRKLKNMATITFSLENRKTKNEEKPIRVSILINGVRVVTTIGHNIYDNMWDVKTKEAIKGICNSKKETADAINATISKIKSSF